MIWFLAPLAFTAGAGGSWWITKETAKEVVEAERGDGPQVVIGSNYSVNALTVVIILVLIAWVFWHKKGKR